jgi:aspartate racemase
MNIKPNKKIGVLGGAGPAATAKFFYDLIDIAQKKYKAEQDTDFPYIYLYNMPIEGFSETGFSNPDLVKKQLIAGVKKIEEWGADFVVLPCNTVHFFINEMRNAISIPILSIIEATIDEVKKKKYKKIGVLSSASTKTLALYKKPLEDNSISVLITSQEEQLLLDNIILAVMTGIQGIKEKEIMKSIIQRMKNEGAESIILGCTELPLAINQSESDITLISTISSLVDKTLKYSYGEE